jgi:hypothetical protein
MNIPSHDAESDNDVVEYQRAQDDFETAVETLKITKFDLFV